MNRLGRGYSFEALRAKILFSEGVHKHKYKKPKFERRGRDSEVMMKYSFNEEWPPSTQEREIIGNYGADISTLIEKIEKGEL
jgi:hypothetical protein